MNILNNSMSKHLISSFKRKISDELTNYIVSNITSSLIKLGTLSLTISQYSMEYHNFIKWYNEYQGHNFNKDTLLANTGSQYFMYKKHIFIMNHVSDQDTKVKLLSIKLIGKNKKIMEEFYDEFRFKPSKNITIYNTNPTGGWNYICEVPQRNLDTVVLDANLKSSILGRIKDWQQSKDWYKERGLAYKLGLVFYGPPGTGKTSFIKALASYIGYDLYLMNLSSQSDVSLVRNLSSTGRKSIIVMEDFDSSSATLARNDSLSISGNQPNHENTQEDSGGVTISGLLNALDGLIPLNDRIIIMTTNVLDEVDKALVRKGRIDEIFYFGPLQDKEIKEYIKIMFPNDKLENNEIQFKDINGCDIQDLYMQNKYNFHNFINEIPKK